MPHTVAVLMQFPAAGSQRTAVSADFGRASALLRDEGVDLVVAEPDQLRSGGTTAEVTGWQAGAEVWEPAPLRPLHAIYNRLPSRDPRRYADRLRSLSARGIPVANPPAINRLALDKLDAAEALAAAGLPVPETEADPARFEARLAGWGAAFVKPRHGALGRGVTHVDRPSQLAAALLDPGLQGDAPILQRAVEPLAPDCQGLCVRSFLQRTPDGAWTCAGRVARVHRDQRVANVSRGAVAAPMEELEQAYLPAMGLGELLDGLEPRIEVALEQAAGADAALVLEVGVDWVVDAGGDPWLIEINGKPLGKLGELARRVGPDGPWFEALHRQALLRPFRRLVALYGEGRPRGAAPTGEIDPDR